MSLLPPGWWERKGRNWGAGGGPHLAGNEIRTSNMWIVLPPTLRQMTDLLDKPVRPHTVSENVGGLLPTHGFRGPEADVARVAEVSQNRESASRAPNID